jgi:hypothetical protein
MLTARVLNLAALAFTREPGCLPAGLPARLPACPPACLPACLPYLPPLMFLLCTTMHLLGHLCSDPRSGSSFTRTTD